MGKIKAFILSERFRAIAALSSIALTLVLCFQLFTSSCNSENYGISVRHAKGQGEVGITLEAENFSVPVDVSFGVEMVDKTACTVVRISVAGFTAKGTANTKEPVCVEKFGVVNKIRLLTAPKVETTANPVDEYDNPLLESENP